MQKQSALYSREDIFVIITHLVISSSKAERCAGYPLIYLAGMI